MSDDGEDVPRGPISGPPQLTIDQLLSMLDGLRMDDAQREELRASLIRQQLGLENIMRAVGREDQPEPLRPPTSHALIIYFLIGTVAFILLLVIIFSINNSMMFQGNNSYQTSTLHTFVYRIKQMHQTAGRYFIH